ncbi:hypothetical protein J6590_025204 [Homalodisca vitripennis]|nr:hypothetical protein J6590_025204 [Homalodisca vitripennis]
MGQSGSYLDLKNHVNGFIYCSLCKDIVGSIVLTSPVQDGTGQGVLACPLPRQDVVSWSGTLFPARPSSLISDGKVSQHFNFNILTFFIKKKLSTKY